MPNSDGDYFVEEKTEVIYGAENIINSTLEQWSNLNHFADVCTDYNGPSMFVIPDHPITKAFQQLKDRGIKLRFIAEINNENIQYCKELMKLCELRHLDEIKGNFGLGDGIYYRASAGKTGFPDISAYCASKFGMIGLTESATCEVATDDSMNIRVMTICPGEVDTKMQADLDPEYYRKNKNKMLQPRQIAGKIAEMISDKQHKYHNGQSIEIS